MYYDPNITPVFSGPAEIALDQYERWIDARDEYDARVAQRAEALGDDWIHSDQEVLRCIEDWTPKMERVVAGLIRRAVIAPRDALEREAQQLFEDHVTACARKEIESGEGND